MMRGRRDRNLVLAWALVIAAISSLPYIWGLMIAPQGHQFLGLTHNIDDGAVYLSWMRQAADGHFFIRNLFTNEQHPAKAFNLLFLFMGLLARITHLPLIWVFHLFRVGLGIALMYVIYRFSCLFIYKPEQRLFVVPLVGFSAGVGWLMPGAGPPIGSVDTWQPEAITFLSIYLNPLFLAGLILMLGAFYFLETARRSGRWRDAVFAGVCLLILGNVHTYDVVTVTCVWIAYLVVLGVIQRRFPARTLMLSIAAAAIAAPSVAYQVYLLIIDPLYMARAATPAPSPAVWSYLAGYGFVFIGAIVGAVLHARTSGAESKASKTPVLNSPLLLMVWSVVGFIVPYLPFAQQRKLVMGLHIPLCILCAAALVQLLDRIPKSGRRAAAIACIALMAVTNTKFLAGDLRMLSDGTTAPGFSPYISRAELSAIRWLRTNAGTDDSVFAPPGFALFTPAIAGRAVYYGHWSETPDYGERLRNWMLVEDDAVPDISREAALLGIGSTYFVRYEADGDDASADFIAALSRRCFVERASGYSVAVYRITGFTGP